MESILEFVNEYAFLENILEASIPNDIMNSKIEKLVSENNRLMEENSSLLKKTNINIVELKTISHEATFNIFNKIKNNLKSGEDVASKTFSDIRGVIRDVVQDIVQKCKKMTGVRLTEAIIVTVILFVLSSIFVFLVYKIGIFLSIPISICKIISVFIGGLFIVPSFEKVGKYISVERGNQDEFEITLNTSLCIGYLLGFIFGNTFFSISLIIRFLNKIISKIADSMSNYFGTDNYSKALIVIFKLVFYIILTIGTITMMV